MDLKALMQKLETINTTQIVIESVDPKQVITESVASPVVETTTSVFKSSIARSLAEEFGYALDEAEEFKFSPEQEKWLGGANRQDPNIISRMPGAKPPVSYFKDPADQEIAKKMNFGQSNLNSIKKMVGMEPGAAQTFADPSTTKPTAATKPADAPTAATKPAAAPAAAPAAPDSGAATKPADAPAAASGDVARPGMRPGGTAEIYDLQKSLVAKGAKIATDGIMGPQTQGAIKQFGGAAKPGAATKPADAGNATIDPGKLKRFKELLVKAGVGA
jgi:hypothetical protein